jgi:arylsulfatase A-like enzyme
MIGAHGLLGKTVMYEQSASVPYLIRMPGQQKATHCSQLVSHIDFTPTMLDLLGKPPHPQCVGRSKAGLVRGEPFKPESIFIEWSPGKEKIFKQTKLAGKEQIKEALAESTRAVVTPDNWKLCLRDKDKNELYNLKDDPEERKNLYSDSSNRDVVQRLTDELHQWQGRTSDTIKV